MGERHLDHGAARSDASRQTLDEIVEAAVARSIEQTLRPYLVKLQAPEALVYTVAQAAEVLQISTDTVGRLVRRGLLVRVPHLDGKLLIPKSSVEELIAGQSLPTEALRDTDRNVTRLRRDQSGARKGS